MGDGVGQEFHNAMEPTRDCGKKRGIGVLHTLTLGNGLYSKPLPVQIKFK